MNKTTVKRGIGAVLLALIAAGLLAFLLKDKADQRQDIVDMPLPGSDTNSQTIATDNNGKLPQLSMDNNSGNATADGAVIASAGADSAVATGEGVIGSATGAISASVSAVGDGVSGAVDAVTSAGESALDFTVRPPTAKSSEFRDLSDVNLVNNGNEEKKATPSTSTSTSSAKASTASTQTQSSTPSNTTKGTVVASTSSRSGGGEARLIDERKTAAPRSSRTETVISRQPAANTTRSTEQATPKKVVTAAPAPAASSSTSNTGYAIQLLATSSVSRAQSLVDVMRGEGYKAYYTKVTANGKLLYRVRIGQYKNKAEATKAHQSMKRRYKKNADVNRSAVVSR